MAAPGRGRYHTSPEKFGKYPVLPSSFAMTAYPESLFVPRSIPRPTYVPANFFDAPWGDHATVEVDERAFLDRGIQLGGSDEAKIRKVAALAAEVLTEIEKLVKPGVTTSQLDAAVHQLIVHRGAYPSTLGYGSFPKSCCTSVNNVIAHGIPDDRPLHPEDLINIDLTLYHDGFHGDTSITFLLPGADKLGRNLVNATQEALELGIRACGPGKRLNGIGKAIEDFAERHGFSVNSQFGGHGIGRNFHQSPAICHNANSDRDTMRVGDCFTIEPSLVQGSNSRGFQWDDGWTMATESGARSAQQEHQILITETGAEVLTRRPGEQT
ncbi:peptidase M24, structural domain-containing protein [Dioszegia hungarica]|uniref:Methionine aminopeptidase n=1 Tax=Dioszegia hungarica TaxID=4972 RepID=A0AA38HDK6_9TREE|nr:peptidase M24, structural domain-containing protein [Dioszegia hungarica]KAI9639743.1 peptidase M24, structural domain-containing protein [Dioszegia hungarica]